LKLITLAVVACLAGAGLALPADSAVARSTQSAPGPNSPSSSRRGGDAGIIIAWLVGGLVVAGAIVGGYFIVTRRRDVSGTGQPEDPVLHPPREP
jgi:hypothetical protein